MSIRNGKSVLLRKKWESYVQRVHKSLDAFRQAKVHSYADYSGPWIENYAISYFESRLYDFFPFVPLLAQWTDHQVQAPCDELSDAQRLQYRAFFDSLDHTLQHFAISQHDGGDIFCLNDPSAYKSILIFSAGGWGDVPIPLLKQVTLSNDIPVLQRKYVFSFVGSLTPLRKVLMKRFLDMPSPIFYYESTQNWKAIAKESMFCLCPRGFGRTSFRLSETILLGCIPVYIGATMKWLPYDDNEFFDISSLSLQQSLWGGGIGFGLRYSEIPFFLCRVCTLFLGVDSPSDLSSCVCDSLYWKRFGETISSVGYSIESFRRLVEMESRLRNVRDLFTYAGVLREIQFFLDGKRSRLIRRGKPDFFGTLTPETVEFDSGF